MGTVDISFSLQKTISWKNSSESIFQKKILICIVFYLVLCDLSSVDLTFKIRASYIYDGRYPPDVAFYIYFLKI